MDTQSLVRQPSPPVADAPGVVSRRRILKRAVGLAAVGAVSGTVLSEVLASPASAATKTEQGAVAPSVVSLADASVIAVDASLGNDFRITIGGNRTMSNPSNPTDGQKIVFQVTQGSGAPFAITWGSAYQFSTGLPQPKLSPTAGQTDLVAFIYNQAKGSWLLVAYVLGFNPTTVTLPNGTYRLFPSTNGPSSPSSYSGPYLTGVAFEVTTGGTWLDGYWWWVCPTGQSTSAQKFALWQLYNTRMGTLITSASVTSMALTPGQWNYIALSTPVPLAIGTTYIASTGFNNNFPESDFQFGSGDPYSAGIATGPVMAYSDVSGSQPGPFSINQGLYSLAGTDPTVNMPNNGWKSANLWMDFQVSTVAPAGTSFRLWPNYPTSPYGPSSDTSGYTLGTEFQLSQSCMLDNIWFYSASGATALPTRCAIWDVATQTAVAGTDNTSPAWSGTAGSGWVACSYKGITLAAGDYKVAAFYGGGSPWFQALPGYWTTGGPGASGISAGPLTAPSTLAATGPGQCTFNSGSWAYPLTYTAAGSGENYWVDVEVTPS